MDLVQRQLVLQEGIFPSVSFFLQHRTHQVVQDSILTPHVHSPVASPPSHRRHIRVNLLLACMLPRALLEYVGSRLLSLFLGLSAARVAIVERYLKHLLFSCQASRQCR